jgi:hypothetical protein
MNFLKVQNSLDQIFVSFILLVKLKCNIDQIHGLTLKGPIPFFSKSTPNLPFLTQEARMILFL